MNNTIMIYKNFLYPKYNNYYGGKITHVKNYGGSASLLLTDNNQNKHPILKEKENKRRAIKF
jgi:hypothetical protein